MRHLDQHFFIDTSIVAAMVKTAAIKKEDTILEIGPGKGAITKQILHETKRIIAIELDTSLSHHIKELPVKILYGDALKLLSTLHFTKLISNLPYSLAEPLFKILPFLPAERFVLLIGKKFYDSLQDNTPRAMTLSLFFTLKKILDVPRQSFSPQPRTDAAIILLEKRKSDFSPQEMLLRSLLLQQDKKVKNALQKVVQQYANCSKKEAKEKVAHLQLAPAILNKYLCYLSNRQFMLLYAAAQKIWV